MSVPDVSVAITLYNKEAHIDAALKSVLAQSFANFEIIVIDDGSTDDGAAVVQKFSDPRVKLHRQLNAGVSAARNAALMLARSDLVAFLDADDLWRPQHLQHLMILAGMFPDAVLYGNSFIAGNSSGVVVIDHKVNYELLEDYFARWVSSPEPFHTSSSMARRVTALAIGGFSVGFSRGEDLAFFIRMALAGGVAVSNYVGCLYLRSATGLTSLPVLQTDICSATILELLNEPSRVDPSKRISLREFFNKVVLANAFDCIRTGHTPEALKFLELSSETRTQRWRWWQARLLAGCPQLLRRLAFSIRDVVR
jgi:hypothetical protein